MSTAMRRAASLIAGLALTFTPGVVLACAAMVCAPSGHHGAAAPGAVRDQQAATGYEHHHQTAPETVVAAPGHDHGSHATMSAADDIAVVPVGTPRVESVPRDCCASGVQWSEPAVVAPRLDIGSLIDAVVVTTAHESERGVAPASSGPHPHHVPRHRSTSTRVLRI